MLFTFDDGLLKTMVQKKRRVGAESDIKGLAKWRMGVELEDGLAAAQIETRRGLDIVQYLSLLPSGPRCPSRNFWILPSDICQLLPVRKIIVS